MVDRQRLNTETDAPSVVLGGPALWLKALVALDLPELKVTSLAASSRLPSRPKSPTSPLQVLVRAG